MTEDRPRAASSPSETEERRVSISAPPRNSNSRRSSFTDWLFLDERRSSVAAIKQQESAEEEALSTAFESLEAWDRTHEPLRDADRWEWLSDTSGPIETMKAFLESTIEMLQRRGKAEEAYVAALRECHAPLASLPVRAAAAYEPELAQPIGSLGMRTQAAEDAAASRAFALTQAVAQLRATATTFGDEAVAVRAEVKCQNSRLHEARAAWRRRWDALVAAHGRTGAQAGGVQASAAAVQTEEEDMWLYAHRYLTAAATYATEHAAQSTCEVAQRKRIGLARERAAAALGAVLAAGASDDFGRPHAPTLPLAPSSRSCGAGWSGRSDGSGGGLARSDSGGGSGGGSSAGASAGAGGWSWRSDDTIGSEAGSLASSSVAAAGRVATGASAGKAAAWKLPPNPYEVCSGAVSRLSEGLLRARWVGEWAVLTRGRVLLTFDVASAPPRGGGLPAEAPASQLVCAGAEVEWARGANRLSLHLAAAASPVGAAVRSRLGLAAKAPQTVQLEFADAATAGTWAAALGAEADE